MNRRFKIVYYLLVAFFTAVFTYQLYQLTRIALQKPNGNLMVTQED